MEKWSYFLPTLLTPIRRRLDKQEEAKTRNIWQDQSKIASFDKTPT
jgi:hypothetical protein